MPELQKCARCGAELPPLAPGAHCHRCALEIARNQDDIPPHSGNVSAIRLSDINDPLPPAVPGDRIGRYKLLQKIGEGGCGVVYMAEQEQPLKRRVALKVIKPGMDSKEVLARFEA